MYVCDCLPIVVVPLVRQSQREYFDHVWKGEADGSHTYVLTSRHHREYAVQDGHSAPHNCKTALRTTIPIQKKI